MKQGYFVGSQNIGLELTGEKDLETEDGNQGFKHPSMTPTLINCATSYRNLRLFRLGRRKRR